MLAQDSHCRVLHAHLPRPLSLGSRLRERDLLPSFFL